jgi:hypothetical protein
MQQDLYIANKYISSNPSDYSCTHIPTLNTTSNGLPTLAEVNSNKVATLTESSPPPQQAPMSHPTTHTPPLFLGCASSPGQESNK